MLPRSISLVFACLAPAILFVPPILLAQSPSPSPLVSPKLPAALVEELAHRAREHLRVQRPALGVDQLRLSEINLSCRPDAGAPGNPSVAETISVRFVDPSTRVEGPRAGGGRDVSMQTVSVAFARDKAAERLSVQDGKMSGYTFPRP